MGEKIIGKQREAYNFVVSSLTIATFVSLNEISFLLKSKVKKDEIPNF